MLRNAGWRRVTVCIAAAACVFLTGCGDGVSGTYASDGPIPMSMTFKGGGKATVSGMGETKEATYTVDGDKVVVTLDGNPATFVKQKDGSLAAQGEMMGMTLKKK
jgi:hypothetical protein